MASNNSIIKISDGRYFGGWDRLGQMIILGSNNKNLAYRMSHILAERTLCKVSSFCGLPCTVECA